MMYDYIITKLLIKYTYVYILYRLIMWGTHWFVFPKYSPRPRRLSRSEDMMGEGDTGEGKES